MIKWSKVLLVTVPFFLQAAAADAALITFASRPAFSAAAPGLPVETFESGLVAPGGVTTCAGPVSSGAASACFPLGGLLPGATYAASPGPLLALLGAGFPVIGNPSKVLGPNAFADTFNITFASATAVGFDVFPGFTAGSVQISIFDPLNVLLGMFTIAAPIGGTFFGVISTTDLIGRINIASLTATPGELVDNVAFGVAQVPEPGLLLLLGSGALTAAARGRLRKSRKKHA